MRFKLVKLSMTHDWPEKNGEKFINLSPNPCSYVEKRDKIKLEFNSPRYKIKTKTMRTKKSKNKQISVNSIILKQTQVKLGKTR